MDNFGRPTTWDWWRSGGAAFYDVDIAYDQNSNPTNTTDNIHVRDSSGNRIFDVLYGLDQLDRVITADEGKLASGSISNRTSKQAWTLSQTGNWTGSTTDQNGDGTNEYNFGTTTFNKANEWTARTNSVGSYTENMTYDANGNMTQWGYREGDGQRYTYTYDAFGRLMKVQTDIGAGAHDHTKYRYNGLGFRIAWLYDTDASQTLTSSEQFYFMYDERWRIVSIFRNTDQDPKELFAYHAAGPFGIGVMPYIDSVILRDKDANTGWTSVGDGTLEERRFYCQNWRADVAAITKSDGLPVEFIRYSSYGKSQVFAVADVNRDGIVNATDSDDWDDLYSENPSGAAIPVDFNFDGSLFDPADYDDFNALYSSQSGFSNGGQLSSLGNRKGYSGYEFDQAVEAYHVRHRVYLPEVGRWIKRDPLGYAGSNSLYEYALSMPVALQDPTGLVPPGCCSRACPIYAFDNEDRYLDGPIDRTIHGGIGTVEYTIDPNDPDYGTQLNITKLRGSGSYAIREKITNWSAEWTIYVNAFLTVTTGGPRNQQLSSWARASASAGPVGYTFKAIMSAQRRIVLTYQPFGSGGPSTGSGTAGSAATITAVADIRLNPIAWREDNALGASASFAAGFGVTGSSLSWSAGVNVWLLGFYIGGNTAAPSGGASISGPTPIRWFTLGCCRRCFYDSGGTWGCRNYTDEGCSYVRHCADDLWCENNQPR